MKSKNSQTNQIKENLVATLRALIANEKLLVEFDGALENNFFSWDQGLVVGESGVLLPDVQSKVTYRASSDLAACYLLFHEYSADQEKKRDEKEQKFFNEFEKIRVLACVKNSYRGVVKNILAKVESDIFSGSISLSLILLKEIFSAEILPRTKEVASDLEREISVKILQEIKNLARVVDNQTTFTLAVERILELLKSEKNSDEKNEEEEKSNENPNEENKKSQNELPNFAQENVENLAEENFSSGEEDGTQKISDEPQIADFRQDDSSGEIAVKLDQSSSNDNQIEFKNAYKIYTSKFDQVILPQKLINKNELELLRDQLDLKMGKLVGISKKMSLRLKRKLLSKKNSFVERDASRGILDRKKLVRLVIDPLVEDVWVTQKTHEYQDTALTILLDNSGSMRGNPIVMSALACEIIAEILEKFSVKTEIIGFTTADWKGGKARKLWESEGSPKNPGRLNELRHVIYKHFNQSLKKSKVNLGLMLKEGALKENIDGEALLFARSRLMQRSEKRKILLVISDGTPIDDSTASANDSDILSDHLRHVIKKIEQRAQIEIVGVGIGHSTDDFYHNSIAIKSLEELGDGMIGKIAELL